MRPLPPAGAAVRALQCDRVEGLLVADSGAEYGQRRIDPVRVQLRARLVRPLRDEWHIGIRNYTVALTKTARCIGIEAQQSREMVKHPELGCEYGSGRMAAATVIRRRRRAQHIITRTRIQPDMTTEVAARSEEHASGKLAGTHQHLCRVALTRRRKPILVVRPIKAILRADGDLGARQEPGRRAGEAESVARVLFFGLTAGAFRESAFRRRRQEFWRR